ncbi:hypothetical protein APHMUC_0500 [Anaplasma phagocytophilum str. ApMUC09]|uniref:Uncharacterized protein n=1 Tax=Anaplasma phagocytophilum str. ApMUC09 TaxID=1359152 RepID=A0A0F3N9R7_ANAPH|nr:hypothetical protein APHMUC_0500 [Anaplasma phagocytophilum str. ApMUC09]
MVFSRLALHNETSILFSTFASYKLLLEMLSLLYSIEGVQVLS